MMSAAARGMPFFMRHHKAGAHRVVAWSAILTAAFSDAHTAQGGVREAPTILGKFEMRFGLPRRVAGAQAQVIIHAIRIDDLARVHLPLRVPDGLELAERLN